MEEALHLTNFAERVFIVHRRAQFRASKVMQERVLAHPKIEVKWNCVVAAMLGAGERLTAVRLAHPTTGAAVEELPCRGLFYAMGHVPASAFLQGPLGTDEEGYLLTTPGRTTTSVPGVFAAGDVQDRQWRQAITAAASGCMAALEAERFLSH